MKIAIVGADSRAWAKIPDGEAKAKDFISKLLDEARLFNPDITVVSGHCPVGKEVVYCADCKAWLIYVEGLSGWGDIILHGNHRKVKVYTEGGIDTWVEQKATELGLKKEIYPAEVNQWNNSKEALGFSAWVEKKGYRSRNIQIAEAGLYCEYCQGSGVLLGSVNGENCPICNGVGSEPYVLYDIEPAGSCGYCSGRGIRRVKADEDSVFIFKTVTCPKCEGDGAYSGGTFTKKEADKRGRETHKVIIS